MIPALSFEERQILTDEAWFRGDLSYKFHTGQDKIYSILQNITQKLFVINCSRRFGKSFLMVAYVIMRALNTPGTRIRYATAFLTDLEEFIIPLFDLILEDCPELIKPKYLGRTYKFKFSNGSEIKLVGVDKKPNGLRGNGVDVIILDEAGFISNLEYLYKSIILPTTINRKNAKIIMVSTPSPDLLQDFRFYCEKAELENSYAKFTIYDNPLISGEELADIIKESGGVISDTFRREYLCEFIIAESLRIIAEFSDEYVQEVETDKYFNYYHKYDGMDLGVKDYTACIFGYYNFTEAKLIIQDEYIINGPEMTTDILADAIRSKETELWPEQTPYKRIADNNNLLLINDLNSIHKLYFSPTSKDTLAAMVNEVRLWVKQGRVIISPKCKQLIGCLKYGIWNNNRTEFSRNKVYGHFDALAALIYLIRNIDESTNPIPEYVDKRFEQFIPPNQTDTKNQAAFKQILNRK